MDCSGNRDAKAGSRVVSMDTKVMPVKPQHRAPTFRVLREVDFRSLWCGAACRKLPAGWSSSPLTGLLADRFSRRRILFGAQCLAIATGIGVLLALLSGTVQPSLVYLAVALMGITKALEDSSRCGAILDIVGSQRLVNALSVDGMNHTIGKVLGPLVGGTLVETIGYAGACGCILATHIINFGLMTQLRIPPSQGSQQKDSIWRSLVVAVRAARHSPLTLGMLYVTVVMNALAFPIRQFIPVIGTEYLGVGAGWVGLLAAAEGFGQLIGAGIVASTHNLLSHGRVFVAGSALVLRMALLFVWAPWYGLAFVLLAIGGCGQAGFSTMQRTIAMLGAPPEMRSRMMGLLSVCIGLSTPLRTLGIGMLAAAFTVPAATTANALTRLLLLWPAVTLTPLMQPSPPSPYQQDDGFESPDSQSQRCTGRAHSSFKKRAILLPRILSLSA